MIDLSNNEGYTWHIKFSYEEPLTDNFLLFKTVDE